MNTMTTVLCLAPMALLAVFFVILVLERLDNFERCVKIEQDNMQIRQQLELIQKSLETTRPIIDRDARQPER